MRAAERTFRVMGSEAQVIVSGGSGRHLRRVQRLLESLERRWSRFLTDSDISRLNREAGTALTVAPETVRLISSARSLWESTDGLFDPTVLYAVQANGYTTDAGAGIRRPVGAPTAAPGFDGISLNGGRNLIRFDRGCGFDPGGIGKGLAADMAIEELSALGVDGALVSIGGDLRTVGSSPQGAWTVAVEDPDDPEADLTVLSVHDAAIATSNPRHGRWVVDGRRMPHVLDPRTGDIAATDVAAATIVAADCATAEAVATAVVVAGSAEGFDLVHRLGLDAIIVTVERQVLTTPWIGAFT